MFSKNFLYVYDKIIKNFLGSLVKKSFISFCELKIKTINKHLISLLNIMCQDSLMKFKVCTDIVVSDKPGKHYRFTVIYYLTSYFYNVRIIVYTQTNGIRPLQSITSIYNSAVWSEREIWDMYGIFIVQNKDLRRILTDYGFSGHPLRKDFPLTGFLESTYDDLFKKIISDKVELTQAYRVFTFPRRWKGY